MKILLIEDDKAFQDVIPAALLAGGMPIRELRLAETLHDGCNEAYGWRPDVILLDLGLPDSHPESTAGPDVLRKLAAIAPVVIVTGYDNQTYWLQARQHGAADYLFKRAFLAKGCEPFLTHAILNAAFGSRAIT